MKLCKKYMSLAVVLVLLCSLTTPCSAYELSSPSLPDIQVGQKIGDFVVVNVENHTMSTDEVIEYYINEKQYSLEEAQAEALQLLLDNKYISTITVTVNATDDLGKTSNIELGCRVRVATGSGHSNFEEILSSWTGIVSSGIQEWNEFTHSAEIVGARKVSIDFYARGTIEVVITNATSSGFSVELLESLGYSIETSSSKDWHIRKVVDLEGTYTMPGY